MTKNHSSLSDAHMIFLRNDVQRMHYRGEFCHLNLRRKVSKHCKTFLTGKRFGIKVKKSEYGIFGYIGDTVDGITVLKVHSCKFPDIEFTFNVKNNKEFLEKVLKQNLL